MVEPSVAEKVFTGLVASEPRIRLLLKHYPTAVRREGALLQSVTLREFDGPKSLRVLAAVFADATYERTQDHREPNEAAAAARAGLRVTGAIATHDHPDHVGGSLWGLPVRGLADLPRPLPVHVHRADAERLRQRFHLEE